MYFSLRAASLCKTRLLTFCPCMLYDFVREIRALLYESGYTIGGARQRLSEEGDSNAVAMDKALIKNMINELKELEELLRS